MAKSKSRLYGGNGSLARTAKTSKGNDEGGKFVDRNLMSVNPNSQQFEPTSAAPVPQRYKMGGGC